MNAAIAVSLVGGGEIARNDGSGIRRRNRLIRRFGKMSRTAMSQFICLPVRTGSGDESARPLLSQYLETPGEEISFPWGGEQRLGAQMIVGLIFDGG